MSTTQFQLTVTRGPDVGRSFRGTVGRAFRIGRGTETETALTDASVSRLQCELVAEGSRVRLVQRSQSVPTLVNGRPTADQVLVPGDTLQVGETAFEFYFVGESAAPKQPPADQGVSPGEQQAWGQRQIGTRLHKYLLQKTLAEGRTGVVFLADHEGAAEPVAVKVFWPQVLNTPESRQRFVRAMKAMYPVRHPHIVRIENAGYTDEFCWLAMEYIDGENLQQRMQRLGAASRLDWQQAYRVGLHIARALVAAEQQQVVHRNIQPKNILVRHADQSAVLGDLMLAKATESDADQQITRAGQLIGDVAYLAPERTGGTVHVDTRCDIYSLGATLYELITGRPPFVAQSLAGLLIAIRTEALIPAKTYQLSVHDLFAGLIERMLSKDPAERPQTAEALVRELDRVGRMAGVTI